jgi:hypothetical protein
MDVECGILLRENNINVHVYENTVLRKHLGLRRIKYLGHYTKRNFVIYTAHQVLL